MFNSVLPAIKTQSLPKGHEALVIAHNGEMMLAVQRCVESRLTINAMLENSPPSVCVEFEPQAKLRFISWLAF